MSAIDIAKLSPEERLELLEQLWDSLSPEAVPMTDDQAGASASGGCARDG